MSTSVTKAEAGRTGDPGATQGTPHVGRSGWRVVGAVFAALTLAFGVLTVVSWLARQTETQDQTYQRRVTRIVLDLDTGDLAVTPGNEDTVTVRRHLAWSLSRPTIEETWDGETLRVRVRCARFTFDSGCRVDYLLQVPRGVAVEAHSDTGDLTVRDLDGSLRLTTDTGDIGVSNAHGTLWVRADTGDVRAAGLASAEADVATDTGAIELRFSRPPSRVQVATDTGDISIGVPTGDAYRVQTSTDTGSTNIRILQDVAASRTIIARTDTGDMDVFYG